ncbi:nidogen-like domain-containing protein [Plasticicumulans sp.]|uniref:nidogen-like domain-containing protein n=1 Tax=Plasticicumulans sp. TaxID=2307179 RepID=UPI00394078D5
MKSFSAVFRVHRPQPRAVLSAALLAALAPAVAGAASLSANYDASYTLGGNDVTAALIDNFDAAMAMWEAALPDSSINLSIDVRLANLGGDGNAGLTTYLTRNATSGQVNSARIDFNNNTSLWYLDASPTNNDEFDMVQYFRNYNPANTAEIDAGRVGNANVAAAQGNWDFLSVAVHEIGHALGFGQNGSDPANYTLFGTEVGDGDVDIDAGFNVLFEQNRNPITAVPVTGSHIDGSGANSDYNTASLADPGFARGQRSLISDVDTLAIGSLYDLPADGVKLNFDYDQSVLLTGLGGPAGYGELTQGRNDDGSSGLLDLPFEINFFGNVYDALYVNNNGNLTFNSPLGTFTPESFPVANQPMIAPYWGDVDTRCAACGEVYIAAPDENTVVVTWDQVGYYSNHSDLLNTFQAVLRKRADTNTAGQTGNNFDVEFRYGSLNWTTGDASGGTGGFGGTPAQAGFDAGDGINFLALPGSLTGGITSIEISGNTTPLVPGLWTFAIRNGALPGSTPDNPLLPVVTDTGFVFDFNVGDINDQIFIDPIIAIGYDYFVDSGPNFASVLLPTGIGDDLFDLWLFDALLNDWVDSGVDIAGGTQHFFAPGGVSRFRILGIEIAALLDPDDPTAFVTGLTFAGTGQVSMRQVAIRFDTDQPIGIPEPAGLALLAFGLLTMFGRCAHGRRFAA